MDGFCLCAAVALLVVSPVARTQQFASVVIKPSPSGASGESRLQVLSSGELIGHSVPVIELIALAYEVPENPTPRLDSLPEWAVRQGFEIAAKTPTDLRLETKDIPTQRRTIALLLQNLLKDHFALILTTKSIVTPVYALTRSDHGHKLRNAGISPKECILDTDSHGCHTFAIGFGHPLIANAVDASDLALYLENWTDLPVTNRIAPNRLFEMHSQGWRPMNLPPPPPGASGTGAEFASLPTLSAVLDSLGFQLLTTKQMLPFYTITRIEQPSTR